MLKEQTTTYAYKLKYLENPTFDRIRAFANTFINELPTKLTTELYDSLNRGTDLLDSEPSMLVYLYSLGEMYQAKLNYAFNKIPDGFMEQSEINIIDYGCGQAVGTMCYADYLKARGDNQKIKSITLIEPSEICLKRAALHASVFFPDAEITTINKKFDELDGNDISTSEDTPTLHILFNVLDLDFDLREFSELIKSKLVGYNQFVCVDPYFGYSDKDQRMNKFANLIGGNVSFSKILEKGELNPDKNWTCQTVILSVGKLEGKLSTKVTDEEIRNGITDEYGVVYSKDGKRLLKCKDIELNNYEIKKGTEVICDEAFMYCGALESIVLPSSVTSIGDLAFYYCWALKAFTLTSSVTNIGDGAFEDCNSLREIKIIDNPLFVVENDMLIDQKNMKLLAYFGTKSDVTIPSSVTSIGNMAFCDCESMESVTIPSSVMSIGESAFSYCNSLKSITIPSSVTNIGKDAFSACDSLESITLPLSVTNINDYTFDGCSSLESITIPLSVTNIKDFAFRGCSSLESIVVPSSVVSIGNSAFRDCESLESITIPSSVTSIGDSAFEGCSSLETVVLPFSVASIGDKAFLSCWSLKTIIIPSSVTSIGFCAFECCCSLESVRIPSSVMNIGDGVFAECSSLSDVKITDNPLFVVDNDMLIDLKNAKLLAYFGTESDVTIPSSVTIIGNSTFRDCKSLESINIPPSVTNIGEGAFYDCFFLKSVTLPSSVKSIGFGAFYGCRSLVSVQIPSSVMNIGDSVFAECISLRDVKITDNPLFVVDNDMLIDMRNAKLLAFFGTKKDVTLPSSVKSIGEWAFRWCYSLESVIIPSSVKSIGKGAFYECISLKTITLPSSITSRIENNVFSFCNSLESIIIPENGVEQIKQILSKDLWDKLSCQKSRKYRWLRFFERR